MKKRRSIRLQNYDYTESGAYCVTICTHERGFLFGEVVAGEMRLNDYGHIVQAEWEQTAVLRKNVELDAFVIMPNHIHGIIAIVEGRGMMHHAPTITPRQFAKPVANSLSSIVGTFKAAVTRQINRRRTTPLLIWQRNYYEHIIRDESDLDRIRIYVETNPMRWHEDSLFIER